MLGHGATPAYSGAEPVHLAGTGQADLAELAAPGLGLFRGLGRVGVHGQGGTRDDHGEAVLAWSAQRWRGEGHGSVG